MTVTESALAVMGRPPPAGWSWLWQYTRAVMRIGFHLTPFWSPTERTPTRIIDEAIEVVAAASRMGFAWVSIGQHWLSHPSVWPQPFPLLGRLAPETGSMRLKTSVLLLPILNAVEVAENVATLDHIAHGRLDVGVAIGYRELELGVAGLGRSDRVAKLEESLELMKRLWRGEAVTFQGHYTRVEGGRMGFTPYQTPHPPLEMGAQSEGAARRAARLTDGVFFGPQLGWADVARFGARFREERAKIGSASPGYVGASRSLIVGADKESAAAAARGYLDKTFAMYRGWRMQERTMGRLQLGFETSLDDWTIHGSPRDCVETLERARAMGVERIGFTIYSLPPDARARIDYLQMIAEQIVTPVGHADARRA
jgi:alkanesulfonate monooxygenase SsuD/methylene tetrahydromethanopterin reductase-like flavin-dependent oxidoreductase (luciferase family)